MGRHYIAKGQCLCYYWIFASFSISLLSHFLNNSWQSKMHAILIETATHSTEMFSGCLKQTCVTLHLMCLTWYNVQCCVVTVRILGPFGLHYCSDFLKCQSHSTHLSTSLRDRMNMKRQNSREQIQSTRRRGNKTFSYFCDYVSIQIVCQFNKKSRLSL